MREYTQVELQQLGYEILNAKITNVDLSMAIHGSLVLWLTLEGKGWIVDYGGFSIGKGYVGASEFEGLAKGTELIMRVMDVVEVETFQQLKDKYVRVAVLPYEGRIDIIGNIISDKWFNIVDFFKIEETVSEPDPEIPADPTATVEEPIENK